MTAVTDDRIDPDRMIFEGVDTYRESTDVKGKVKVKGPIFTVSEMAKFFFGRTNHWIRWKESSGSMVDGSGKPVGKRRDPKMGNRIYTLGDIEQIAHALAANGSITGTQLRHTLRILKSQGEMYEIL